MTRSTRLSSGHLKTAASHPSHCRVEPSGDTPLRTASHPTPPQPLFRHNCSDGAYNSRYLVDYPSCSRRLWTNILYHQPSVSSGNPYHLTANWSSISRTTTRYTRSPPANPLSSSGCAAANRGMLFHLGVLRHTETHTRPSFPPPPPNTPDPYQNLDAPPQNATHSCHTEATRELNGSGGLPRHILPPPICSTTTTPHPQRTPAMLHPPPPIPPLPSDKPCRSRCV